MAYALTVYSVPGRSDATFALNAPGPVPAACWMTFDPPIVGFEFCDVTE